MYWLLTFFLALRRYKTNGKLEVLGSGFAPKVRLKSQVEFAHNLALKPLNKKSSYFEKYIQMPLRSL